MKRSRVKMMHQVLDLVEKQGPICTADLAKILGKTPGAVRFQINMLWHSNPKQIYLAGFTETVGQGRDGRMWAAGDQPDASKEVTFVQPKKTLEEVNEARELALRQKRLSEIKPFRDPLVAALFGSRA
jgi:predicted ArsR family transcriptional regulator